MEGVGDFLHQARWLYKGISCRQETALWRTGIATALFGHLHGYRLKIHRSQEFPCFSFQDDSLDFAQATNHLVLSIEANHNVTV